MTKASRGPERREDALSRERIVEAAIELLDEEGEGGLTFRALATRLATGAGAIYWHIANKSELLVAATDFVVTRAMGEVATAAKPRAAIQTIALGVYEAIDAHPWVGTQLSRAPWETAMLQIFERIGHQVQALGVGSDAQFTSASALLSYMIGVSIQNAANGRELQSSLNRAEFLEMVSARWQQLDPHEYPFIRNVVARRLPKHDDRAEFVAGIDLILTGITSRPKKPARAMRSGARKDRVRRVQRP